MLRNGSFSFCLKFYIEFSVRLSLQMLAQITFLIYYHINIRPASLGVIIISIVSCLSLIHPLSIVALNVVLMYSVIQVFHFIHLDISALRHFPSSTVKSYARLRTLKKYHAIACASVDQINSCFGWIFVSFVSFHTVAFITSSFYLFSHLNSASIMEVGFFTIYVCRLGIICCIPELLGDEVRRLFF